MIDPKTVDRKKLVEAIKNITGKHSQLVVGRKYVYNSYYPYKGQVGDVPNRATLLCALQAHLRGHLHITKKRVPVVTEGGGGKVVTDCSYEQQEEFVLQILGEFLKTEEQLAAEAAAYADRVLDTVAHAG